MTESSHEAPDPEPSTPAPRPGRRPRHALSRRVEALGWWGRLVAAVLTAGALAGAVQAIGKLVDDGRDIAEITSGDVTAPVRLSEYADATTLRPSGGGSSLGRVVLRAAVAPTGTARSTSSTGPHRPPRHGPPRRPPAPLPASAGRPRPPCPRRRRSPWCH